MTANVIIILGNISSSGLFLDRCNIKELVTTLRASNSPKAGCSPNMGFASITFGCFRPLYVVAKSSPLIIMKYDLRALSSYREYCNPFRFTFDLYVIDLIEASLRTLSSSEL